MRCDPCAVSERVSVPRTVMHTVLQWRVDSGQWTVDGVRRRAARRKGTKGDKVGVYVRPVAWLALLVHDLAHTWLDFSKTRAPVAHREREIGTRYTARWHEFR